MISLIFYFQTKVEVLTLFLQKFFVLLAIIGKLFCLVAALRLYIFRLVLSIDSDLHVFDLSVGCVEFCLDSSKGRLNHSKGLKEKHSILTEEDGNVVELCFLPDRDVFMVLLSTGTIVFMSPNNRYTHGQVFYNDRKFISNLSPFSHLWKAAQHALFQLKMAILLVSWIVKNQFYILYQSRLLTIQFVMSLNFVTISLVLSWSDRLKLLFNLNVIFLSLLQIILFWYNFCCLKLFYFSFKVSTRSRNGYFIFYSYGRNQQLSWKCWLFLITLQD